MVISIFPQRIGDRQMTKNANRTAAPRDGDDGAQRDLDAAGSPKI